MTVSIGWLIVTIVVFFLLQIFDEKERQLRTDQIIDERNETEMESLNTVSLINADYHDLQHDLFFIESLMAEGKHDQAYDYLRRLPNSGARAVPRIVTDNNVINSVVNQKYWKARSKSICIVPFMNNIPNLPIEDHDLVAILSNMLDNAIEACEQVAEKRIIQLKLIYKDDNLIVSVRNPVAHNVQVVGGSIATSKQDKERHGHGLRSIQRSLDRYDAAYGMECKDNFFQHSAVIPITVPL